MAFTPRNRHRYRQTGEIMAFFLRNGINYCKREKKWQKLSGIDNLLGNPKPKNAHFARETDESLSI